MTHPLEDDLKQHLWFCLENKPARKCRWVMSQPWLDDIRAAFPPYPTSVIDNAAGYVLGLPVIVRSDGGAPHLEPCD